MMDLSTLWWFRWWWPFSSERKYCVNGNDWWLGLGDEFADYLLGDEIMWFQWISKWIGIECSSVVCWWDSGDVTHQLLRESSQWTIIPPEPRHLLLKFNHQPHADSTPTPIPHLNHHWLKTKTTPTKKLNVDLKQFPFFSLLVLLAHQPKT